MTGRGTPNAARWTSASIPRLEQYWKIEAANALLIPVIAAYIVYECGGAITIALVLSMLACSGLLVIGTIALRMMLGKARRNERATKGRVALLLRARWPAIGLCVAAAAALSFEWIRYGPQPSAGRVASAMLLLLAALEYINYYHVQLQHFDNAADWRRLRSGRGFRKSHLAREIDRWKRDQSRGAGGPDHEYVRAPDVRAHEKTAE